MKKILITIISVSTLIILAGSTSSCDLISTPSSPPSSYSSDTSKVEETQQRVQEAVPIPEITTSAERKNIVARAKLFDNENKITYIYLVNYGKVMAFFTVKGKVSSLNSYITPLDKLVYGNGSKCTEGNYTSTPRCYVVSAPDIDGAYGENADGIFFFTTEGAYVEWRGDYMVSDQPLRISTPVELIREVK